MPNFRDLPEAPLDPIMLANREWPDIQSQHAGAVNTTIGVMYDTAGTDIWRPDAVNEAIEISEADTQDRKQYGYQVQAGDPLFLQGMTRLIFGDTVSQRLEANLIAIQTDGGTGALSRAAQVIDRLLPRRPETGKIPLILDNGWPNYRRTFRDVFAISDYKRSSSASNQAAILELLESADADTVICLQGGGYNDDGNDRTPDQWDEVLNVVAAKELPLILDTPYLGLANGFDEDRYPIVQAVARGILTFVTASASKNMGLYGERVGALLIANTREVLGGEQHHRLIQTTDDIVRGDDSSPPRSKAKAVGIMLDSPDLYDRYTQELDVRRGSLNTTRQLFATALGKGFTYVGEGKGLFTKLQPEKELSVAQLLYLRNAGILALVSSRVNLGGIPADRALYVGNKFRKALTIPF